MQLDAFVTACGALFLGAATVRAVMTIGRNARERSRAAARQRRDVESFRSRAQKLFGQLDPVHKTASARWRGTRPFRVIRRIGETADRAICSFYLEPVDGQPIPAYEPGQFLSFAIPAVGNGKIVHRCYSLSDAPLETQSFYRISIKRICNVGTPAGIVSNYFHDRVFEGDIVDVIAPSGTFSLDQASERPIVLIAGGIGITPLLSMLNWLAATRSRREIWLFHGVHNRADHSFQNHVSQLCQSHANVRSVTFYSRPTPACRRGIDFDVEGHVRAAVLTSLLKARNYEFYLCGPPAMMTVVQASLVNWGVPAKDIMTEQFGAPTNEAHRTNGVAADRLHGNADTTFQVEFLRSGQSVVWSARNGSLLELAEACGINARCSCRAGQCGSCKVQLRSGRIAYRTEPAAPAETGTCLPCIAQPASDLVLDM